MSNLERDRELFTKRPVTEEAINAMRELCTWDECDKIECLAIKAVLVAYGEMKKEFIAHVENS